MKIAVVDTETSWYNELMSIGIVIADADGYRAIDSKYYVLTPEYKSGGMYSDVLFFRDGMWDLITSRKEALQDMDRWLKAAGVECLYAYNANFDKKILTEFSGYQWFDIMRLAAYKQYNHSIPEDAECCKTGRLRRDYGVEPVSRMLSGNRRYCETHNALQDALDELGIMRMLSRPVEEYEVARI